MRLCWVSVTSYHNAGSQSVLFLLYSYYSVYVFIMSLSTAALRRRKPAAARTSHDSCRTQERKKHPVCSRTNRRCIAVLRVTILSCGMLYRFFFLAETCVFGNVDKFLPDYTALRPRKKEMFHGHSHDNLKI